MHDEYHLHMYLASQKMQCIAVNTIGKNKIIKRENDKKKKPEKVYTSI